MKTIDILYCSLLGLCNWVILRELLTNGVGRTLAQGLANPRIRVACIFGTLFILAGGILHRTAGFNPDLKNVFNWSLVFVIPLFLAIITKRKLDQGLSNLEKGKALWQSRLTYRHGIVEPANSVMRDDPAILQAEHLITQSIELASHSNSQDAARSVVNAAIGWQELGLLHRALNEFDKADSAFNRSLKLLHEGGLLSGDERNLAAYRETCFRLGEMYHATSKTTEALKYYKLSLTADEQLGHDDPRGEQETRDLLQQLVDNV